MRLGEFIAVILQFTEKLIRGSFLQYVVLLVIGLKILSLKHKNEENESFSPTKRSSQRISHKKVYFFLYSPWWLWLQDMWSCPENIGLRIQSKWGKTKFVNLYTPQEKYKTENLFNNMASCLHLLRWVMLNGELKCIYRTVEWVGK